jgi:hypothetical protein
MLARRRTIGRYNNLRLDAFKFFNISALVSKRRVLTYTVVWKLK